MGADIASGIPDEETERGRCRKRFRGSAPQPYPARVPKEPEDRCARRLACNAQVVEVFEDEQGHVLDVGRKRRRVTEPLARALQQRDDTCQFPGCCRIRHLQVGWAVVACGPWPWTPILPLIVFVKWYRGGSFKQRFRGAGPPRRL